MSGPKPPLQKPRLAAEADPLARLAAALEALAGPDWDRLRYGVAVSGGADSMALLGMMAKLLPGQVWAATVDHQLRAAAAEEAAMVARWCADAHIPHHILYPETAITGSIQAEARYARYARLLNWRGDERIDYILTAHHADDQLETMIMRLNRGSGVGGLAGIRPRQDRVLRPLLDWRRGQLESWVKRHDIPFVDDPTNADPRFDRARLRAALAGQRLIDADAAAKSARWLGEAEAALEWMVDRLVAGWPDGDDVHIIRDQDYPDELFRRILSRRLRALQPGLTIRGVALDGVIRAMRAGRRAMVGNLLIDRCAFDSTPVWRISEAPRRRMPEK